MVVDVCFGCDGAPHDTIKLDYSACLPLAFTLYITMDAKSQYTVLRIKRKATEAPLSSLGLLVHFFWGT